MLANFCSRAHKHNKFSVAFSVPGGPPSSYPIILLCDWTIIDLSYLTTTSQLPVRCVSWSENFPVLVSTRTKSLSHSDPDNGSDGSNAQNHRQYCANKKSSPLHPSNVCRLYDFPTSLAVKCSDSWVGWQLGELTVGWVDNWALQLTLCLVSQKPAFLPFTSVRRENLDLGSRCCQHSH